eukprot:s196_g38.t1
MPPEGSVFGVRSTGGRLVGMVPDLPDAAYCRRMNKATPTVIYEDELPQDPGDEFRDLISAPAATREPIPARILCAEIPPSTPVGREGLTVMEGSSEPGPLPAAQEKKAKPRDAASALSASSKMTSSAGKKGADAVALAQRHLCSCNYIFCILKKKQCFI